ncbi:iron ABC transporter permease [Chakrabartyella piscis]|uniref:ABC transporter permease n=1 Tax=Chakrabartyella piscis TaxID=2918914 RepID=UPI00295838E9|nr:iron ABC transporter permease [Chakrabartyella piscis]
MSFQVGDQLGFDNYITLFQQERTILAIKNTLQISVLSTLFATIFGASIAYIVAYTDVQYKKLIEVLTICPTVIPSYIITLSWSTVFSRKGSLNAYITSKGLEALNVYSMWGIVLALSICGIPIVYLMTINTLRKIPRDLEFASLTSGYSVANTMFKINLKQAIPSIIGGGILAFLGSIDNFSVPAFLGTSAGIPVLSTYIYEKVIGFGPSSFNLAAALSVMLSVIALSGTVLQTKFVRKSSAMESVKEDYSVRIYLGPFRWFVQTLVLGILLLVNVAPLVTMLMSSVQDGYGDTFFDNFTLSNYEYVFTNAGVRTSVINSLTLAISACIICIIVGTAVAYMKVRHDGKTIRFIEQGIAFTYAVPGIVVALSMIFHWALIPNIYGTSRILLIAYVTRYLILQVKGSVVAVSSVEESLEEASMVCGMNKLKMWIRILIPLLTKQVLASSFLIFIGAMTELSLSSILAAAGSKTIGLTIFALQQGGAYNSSIALSSVMVLSILAAYIVSHLVNRQRSRK